MIKVFRKGNAILPSRLWQYALSTGPESAGRYPHYGFKFSEKDTEIYLNLSDEQKKKVNFVFVDCVKQ